VKPIGGVQWDAGAISTAEWTGAVLSDLLAAAEIKPEAKHLWFDGLDDVAKKGGGTENFGGSIPIDKVYGDDKPTANAGGADPVLVAYEMAGKPLPKEHGFPLRTIVPGYIGARSVKWLSKIVVSDRPSPNHYVADAYKIVDVDEPAAYAAKDPIYEVVTNAAICSLPPWAKIRGGKTTISGYAFAAGKPGNRIKQVEISLDGGKTWQAAKLSKTKQGAYTWDLWSAEVDLPKGDVVITCRATDLAGFTMPGDKPWNAKGYLFNAWHQVPVTCG
jgi:sulfite oxidase